MSALWKYFKYRKRYIPVAGPWFGRSSTTEGSGTHPLAGTTSTEKNIKTIQLSRIFFSFNVLYNLLQIGAVLWEFVQRRSCGCLWYQSPGAIVRRALLVARRNIFSIMHLRSNIRKENIKGMRTKTSFKFIDEPSKIFKTFLPVHLWATPSILRPTPW